MLPDELRGRWNHNTHYYPLALAAPGGERAIEVGCGEGLLLRLLAPRYDEVVGIDPWTAADTCADLPNVRIVREDFLSAVLEPADLVTAFTALHHLDFERALTKLAGLVRPGGRLVVVGVARYTLTSWLLGGFGILPHRVMARRRGYWQHRAPIAAPTLTWRQTRQVVRRVLPGSTFRRRLYWRFSVEWTRL